MVKPEKAVVKVTKFVELDDEWRIDAVMVREYDGYPAVTGAHIAEILMCMLEYASELPGSWEMVDRLLRAQDVQPVYELTWKPPFDTRHFYHIILNDVANSLQINYCSRSAWRCLPGDMQRCAEPFRLQEWVDFVNGHIAQQNRRNQMIQQYAHRPAQILPPLAYRPPQRIQLADPFGD